MLIKCLIEAIKDGFIAEVQGDFEEMDSFLLLFSIFKELIKLIILHILFGELFKPQKI